MAALDAAITSETACVLIQSPNFFGTIEDVAAIAEMAHAKGALLIVSIAEAVSLGIVKPPAEADIVSLEAQSFGVAMAWRAVLRRDCVQGEVPAADAGAADRRDQGCEWQARVCADAVDARAAYPAREGDFEYLHEPGAGGDDGDDLPDGVWQGRDAGVGGAQSGEGFYLEGRR
jgi:cysteine sulfinate desulfinase/cysteine desulfurase-like protein